MALETDCASIYGWPGSFWRFQGWGCLIWLKLSHPWMHCHLHNSSVTFLKLGTPLLISLRLMVSSTLGLASGCDSFSGECTEVRVNETLLFPSRSSLSWKSWRSFLNAEPMSFWSELTSGWNTTPLVGEIPSWPLEEPKSRVVLGNAWTSFDSLYWFRMLSSKQNSGKLTLGCLSTH